jgi:addiction module HigA family antidote
MTEIFVNGEMHNPPHPGEVIKMMHIEPTGITITEAASRLDIDRKTLSRVINGNAAITVEMALRLSKALNTSAKVWLGMQQSYDLWQVSHNDKIDLSRVKPWETGYIEDNHMH